MSTSDINVTALIEIVVDMLPLLIVAVLLAVAVGYFKRLGK